MKLSFSTVLGKGCLLDIIQLFMNSSSVATSKYLPKTLIYSDFLCSCHVCRTSHPHQLRVIEALETLSKPFRGVSECFAVDEVEGVAQNWPARRRRYFVEVVPPSAPEDTRHDCDEQRTEDGSPHGFPRRMPRRNSKWTMRPLNQKTRLLFTQQNGNPKTDTICK